MTLPAGSSIRPLKTKPNSYQVGLLVIICLLLPALAGFAAWKYMHGSHNVSDKQKAVEKFGKVVESMPAGDMTAFLVDTPQGRDVLFSSADGSTLVRGTAYNAQTGDPLVVKYMQQISVKSAKPTASSTASTASVAQAEASKYGQDDLTPGQALGEFKGAIPPVFNMLDKMGGWKEDPSVSVANTVYVVYDPRCPYCHHLFEMTRNLDKSKGITIKWLPTVALGDKGADSEEVRRATYALHAKDSADFALSLQDLSKGGKGVEKASAQDIKAIDANLTFLRQAAKETFGAQPVAVPAAFYIDKRTGAPRMVYGADEPSIFASIFGN